MPRTTDRGDVVVVGAGPAGLVAAVRLARDGLRVLLIDRGGDVADGPLLLDSGARQALDAVGWRPLIEGDAAGFERHSALHLVGHRERHCLEAGWDMSVGSRRPVVERMRRAAVDEGVVWIVGLTAVVPVWTGRRVTGVRVRDADGRVREFSARLVVDASGPSAFIAVALGQLLPRRGAPRARRIGVVEEHITGMSLWLDDGDWVCSARCCDRTLATAVTRPGGAGEDGSADPSPEPGAGRGLRWRSAATIHRSVGGHLRSNSGDGWVAIGEAAGCGAPGSPGATSAAVVEAQSAAVEAAEALANGAMPAPGAFGVTVAMSRRSVQLGLLMDRVLMRASRTGVLGWGVETPWRQRRLRDLLRGACSTEARLGRGWFLWRYDRVSRRARSRT